MEAIAVPDRNGGIRCMDAPFSALSAVNLFLQMIRTAIIRITNFAQRY